MRYPGEQAALDEGELGDAVAWLRWLRNLVHPGAFVRELPPDVKLGEPAFQNAYTILDGIFEATLRLVPPAEDA